MGWGIKVAEITKIPAKNMQILPNMHYQIGSEANQTVKFITIRLTLLKRGI